MDGILYFQVTDPMRASYGSSNYIMAVTQLAQTSLRSVIGKLELDKTFEERDMINAQVVNAIDEAALNWGVKGAALRNQGPDARRPKSCAPCRPQITAEREKRALIAASEGKQQEQINLAEGEREAFIARSEGEKQAAINKAQGEAASIQAGGRCHRRQPSSASPPPSASPAATRPYSSKVAESAVDAYSKVAADANTTLIVPSNITECPGLIASAMRVVQQGNDKISRKIGTTGIFLRLQVVLASPPERWMSGLSRTPGKRV